MNGRLEVACKPNSRVGAISQFVDDSVPLVIEVAKMYWMVSSRSVLMWTLHFLDSEIEVPGREGGHQDSRVVWVPVKNGGRVEMNVCLFYEETVDESETSQTML